MKPMIGLAVVLLIALPCPAQEVLLRHRLAPGQSAKALTEVQMEGDSFLTTEKAATQLRIQMLRDFRVDSVDATGNTNMHVTVQRIRTQGKMDNSSFDRDLSGNELRQVMFGAHEMGVEVSPLGYVRGGNDFSLEQLGISLPSSLGQTGGFEFPTFPFESVRVGDAWTENGRLLRGPQAQRGNISSEMVYKLRRVNSTPHGRVAVIGYRKVTDLSGLGLGGAGQAPRGSRGSGNAIEVGGLVIKLAGEIEFNIDRGIVTKTTQQGSWNLYMNIALTPGVRKKPDLTQDMKIRIRTQFRWTGLQQPKRPFPDPEPSERILPVPEPEIEDLR